ncbi:hypothetical protein GTA08_BOTSDO13812 [Neofusicoccum parvum]|uniref:Uncharacterized protein n=1 Tax=Neofusicoccum parvum TaxID=310453 RepID=A0ACB5RSD0_9PEZI|nr:hypothetical protein GTA08_BOTSDO13812 [Neofusicoccum parvum]
MRRMLLLQWRGVALTVVMAVESLFYIIVFVAQDTRFGEVAGKANEPDAKTWSACLVLTAGNREACMQYTNKLAISQDLVLGSLLLGSLIGTQNFLLLARPSIFVGWWELFRSPFSHIPIFHRRGSDLPLTSLKPSDHHDHHYPPHSAITTADAHDYASTGTIPLMTAASSPSKKSSLLFTTTGRPRSHNTTHIRGSSSPSSTDLPPITITNPYKLSLPSPSTRADDLADTYGANVRDHGGDAFHAGRPSTPPPPLHVAKAPGAATATATASRGESEGRLTPPAHRASAADADAGPLPGVANRHQLPAWAVAAAAEGSLGAAERGAMRGGLALHPVGVGEVAGGRGEDDGSAFSSSGSEEVVGASDERRVSRGSRGSRGAGGDGGTTLREFLAEGGGGEEGGKR